MEKILIVEDDPSIILGLETTLAEFEYSIITANNGEQGLELALNSFPDLIILDLMLPKMNGLEVCRAIRKNKLDIPILMLTSRKEEMDIVLGFEYGADDYVTKPFSLAELKMRIKALIKRSKSAPINTHLPDTYTFGQFTIHYSKMDVFIEDLPLGLSVKEFQILKYMIDNKGKAISRDELLEKIWGYDSFPTTRTVDNYILSLRKKIEPTAHSPKYILTIPTLGYKFVD